MTVSASRAPALLADRYQIEAPIGRGGMAEVLAGTDLRLQRPVAVKFLLPEMAVRDDIRVRFEAEARTAASLSHPHAVAVFDTGEHDGQPYIVMERLPGETLADRIAAGPVDPDWLRQVAGEVLGALAAAHAGGLVHRDVKPGNILLTADGHAKIADFGIAKSLEGTGSDLTGTGQLLGTPAYLAPERLDGAPATAQSDLYSLGVVLYEALAGRCPFPGDTPLATARAVAAGDYRPLADVRPGLDLDLVATVERAMATDPSARFDSAPAMATALARRWPGDAGAPTVVQAAAVAPTSVIHRRDVADTLVGAPVAAEPGLRPRSRLPVAVLVGVVLVALLVAVLNRGDGSTPTAASSGSTSTPTSAAPPATAAPSPTAALAAELRAAAGRLTPSDGARAADLATTLRQVATQLEAGNAGTAATTAIVAVGTWRLTGQLTEGAAGSAVALLSRVPGVTVVNLPSQPVISVPTPGGQAPTGNSTTQNGNNNAAGGKDDDKGRGKGKDD